MTRAGGLLVSMVLGASCSPGPSTLLVQLTTDYAPFAEFDDIVVRAPLEGPEEHVAPMLGTAYGRGARVAVRSLAEGEARASITLMRQGVPIQTQVRRTRVSGASTVLTVRVSRTCGGVSCDDPLASACLAGRCVPDDCTVEHPEHCPAPTCTAASCPSASVACVEASCAEEGVCVDVPRDDLCASGEVCVATSGCVLADAGSHPWAGRWAAVSSSGIAEFVHGIAADDGRVFISAGCDGDDFGGGPLVTAGGIDTCVVAYDGSTGAYLWGRALGSTDPELPGGIAAGGGGVFVSYSFFTPHVVAGTMLVARGSGDLAIVRLDPATGTPVWATRAGGDPFGDDFASSVRFADDSSVYAYSGLPISGTTAPFVPWIGRVMPADGMLVLDETIAAARMLSVNAMSAGGGPGICGTYGGGDFGDGAPSTTGASHALAALYNTGGAIAWTRTLDSPSYATATDCVESGGLFVTGAFRTSLDMQEQTAVGVSAMPAVDGFMAALNIDGTARWIRRTSDDIVGGSYVTRVGTHIYAAAMSNVGRTWGEDALGDPGLGVADIELSSPIEFSAVQYPIALVPYGLAGDATTGRLYVLGMGSGDFVWGGTSHTVTGVSSIVLALDP